LFTAAQISRQVEMRLPVWRVSATDEATDLFGLDCIGHCIEGVLQGLPDEELDDDDVDSDQQEAMGVGLDFARIVDPIKQSGYDSFLKAMYNTITDRYRCRDSKPQQSDSPAC
jgi:hypothetical protein